MISECLITNSAWQGLPGKQPFTFTLGPKISSKPFKHGAAMPNHFLKASREPQATPRTLDIYYFFLETHIYPVLSKQKVAEG